MNFWTVYSISTYCSFLLSKKMYKKFFSVQCLYSVSTVYDPHIATVDSFGLLEAHTCHCSCCGDQCNTLNRGKIQVIVPILWFNIIHLYGYNEQSMFLVLSGGEHRGFSHGSPILILESYRPVGLHSNPDSGELPSCRFTIQP